MDPVVILGAGLTGLSTALHVDGPFVLVERAAEVGGHARSRRRDGFTFDVTGHWLHLRDERVKSLVAAISDPSDWIEIERRTRILSHGVELLYPFQANLHGLPLPVVQECLVAFVAAQALAAREALAPHEPPRTFEAFAARRFGAGIASHFFVPYNRKLWGESFDALTADWISRFVPLPSVDEVIGGAIGLPQEGLGYNPRFAYPRRGGIDLLAQALRRAVEARASGDLRTGEALEELDVVGQRVKLASERDWRPYPALVSTIPLPELIARCPNAPLAVREAAGRLRCVPWRYLDIALRAPSPADWHWAYIPEPRYPFFRVGIYSNALPAMAPPGMASLYVELADRDAALDAAAIVRALVELRIVGAPEDVLFMDEQRVRWAYVAFDEDWAPSRAIALDWLREHAVFSRGRYGAWIYNSMEDCILEGMAAAHDVAGVLGRPSTGAPAGRSGGPIVGAPTKTPDAL
jgi:protoporphyrinogen oxidase